MAMTIAQALRAAKTLKNKLSTLRNRMVTSVSYEEGQEPAFTFKDSLDQYEETAK